MSRTLSLQLPDRAGAINVHVTDAEGVTVAPMQLIRAGEPRHEIYLPGTGPYTIYWQPLGGARRAVHLSPSDVHNVIVLAPDEKSEVVLNEIFGPDIRDRRRTLQRPFGLTPPSLSPSSGFSVAYASDAFAPPARARIGSGVFRGPPVGSSGQKAKGPASLALMNRVTVSPGSRFGGREFSALGTVRAEDSRHFAVGVATDTTPSSIGGWKPYFAEEPISIVQAPDRVSFRLQRIQEVPSARQHRTRFTVALEKVHIRRFLAPLYAGGTEVTCSARGPFGEDLGISVYPSEPTARMIVQALTITSGKDARSLLPGLEQTAERLLGNINVHKGADPWLAVALALTIKRYGWEEGERFTWLHRLSQRFPWISDTHILAAWWSSTPGGGENFAGGLKLLQAARRRGAPYFAEANATVGDLLVFMAADHPDARLRESARRELALWRRNLPFQTRAGATFVWLTKGGRRNRGHIRSDVDRTVLEGRMADLDPAARSGGGRMPLYWG